MFYDFALTIPITATKAGPHEIKVNLVSGVIHQVSLEFPAGCRGCAHVAIYKGAHQVWPTNIDEAFNAEDFTIVIDEAEHLPAGPNLFRLLGWSPNACYNHNLTVRFGILPPEAVLVSSIVDAIKGLLGMLLPKRIFTGRG
ncbi:hypothetical protein ES703_125928 [subsurface metagenome]